MIRVKKHQKQKYCECPNCKYSILIQPSSVKEQDFFADTIEHLIATYIECPVCGYRILKQLDTKESRKLALAGARLELIRRQGKKLWLKQKQKLQRIEYLLGEIRTQLQNDFWDEIYQSLNEDKTETADQELTSGNEVTSTANAGERVKEHESL